jgi:hypothetical protein
MTSVLLHTVVPVFVVSWAPEVMCLKRLQIELEKDRPYILQEMENGKTSLNADVVLGVLIIVYCHSLKIAINRELLSCIEYILKTIPEIGDFNDAEGVSFLHSAIEADAPKSVSLLLQNDWILDQINDFGDNDNPPLGACSTSQALCYCRYFT